MLDLAQAYHGMSPALPERAEVRRWALAREAAAFIPDCRATAAKIGRKSFRAMKAFSAFFCFKRFLDERMRAVEYT